MKPIAIGDKIITTKGFVGDVIDSEVIVEILNEEFSSYTLMSNEPTTKNGKVWKFSDGEFETELVQDVDFRLRERYVVKFKNKTQYFFKEAIRLFDEAFTVVTLKDTRNELHTFIEDKSHNPAIKSAKHCYVSSKIVSPNNY